MQVNAPNKPQSVEVSPQLRTSPEPLTTMPSTALEQDAVIRKDEEPNMEHFAKAAENLVASLDDDADDDDEGEEEVILCVLLTLSGAKCSITTT